MKNIHLRFSCLVMVYGIGLSVMGACASREPSSALPEPVDIPLEPPRSVCLAPTTLDSAQACQTYAHCCGEIVNDVPQNCSFQSADAGAECVCVLLPGYEVRCKDTAGVSCACYRTR